MNDLLIAIETYEDGSQKEVEVMNYVDYLQSLGDKPIKQGEEQVQSHLKELKSQFTPQRILEVSPVKKGKIGVSHEKEMEEIKTIEELNRLKEKGIVTGGTYTTAKFALKQGKPTFVTFPGDEIDWTFFDKGE